MAINVTGPVRASGPSIIDWARDLSPISQAIARAGGKSARPRHHWAGAEGQDPAPVAASPAGYVHPGGDKVRRPG